MIVTNYKFPDNPFGITTLRIFGNYIQFLIDRENSKAKQIIEITNRVAATFVEYTQINSQADISNLYKPRESELRHDFTTSGNYKFPDNPLDFFALQVYQSEAITLFHKSNKILMFDVGVLEKGLLDIRIGTELECGMFLNVRKL